MATRYVPILKGKQGELKALTELELRATGSWSLIPSAQAEWIQTATQFLEERTRALPAGERPAPKAVGLMSGGLDSTLAAALLKEQGMEVVGLYFNTGFCTYDHHRAIGKPGEDPRRLRNHALLAGAEAGVEIPIPVRRVIQDGPAEADPS